MGASSVIVLLFLVTLVAADGDVVGKLTVGYQAWFNVKGDGSPENRWIHWADAEGPHPGRPTVEIYPDTREYQHLYPTALGNLGNGQPAKLFSSWDQDTVDIHFKWMKENNIDVAALQRFANNVMRSPSTKQLYNGDANHVRAAAEKHDRKFYIMWDTSGWNNFYTEIFQDLDNNLRPLGLFNSSAYARQNGKPVLCVWGLGFTDHVAEAAPSLAVIQKLKSLGFYVIGGVPTYWRQEISDSKKNFRSTYLALDMLQPWAVGRFGGVSGAKDYVNVLKEDLALLKLNNVEYQPVLFAGFSWTNMHLGSTPKNQIPRLHGDFMWQQFVNIRTLGIKTAYVAMFDEYDEGTAIAKAAEDKSMIPTDQYFLTLDADGVHVSSDFYLRLVGDGNRMMQGQIPLTQEHPTKHIV